MAKKKTAVQPSIKNQKRGRRVSIEVDKVAMTAAALGTYLIATEVSAAEDDKLSSQAQQDRDLLQAQLGQDLQADPAALAVPELPSDLAQLLGGELPAEALSSDSLSPEFSQAASDVPVADLDGTMLSAASPDATAPGVDGKTVMSDAGSASGSAGSAAGGAADAGAAAGSAAGGAAAGGMPALGALSGIPAGVFAGAIGVAAVAAGGGGGGAASGVAGSVTQVAKGLVVDGNVRGATVFYDANANGKLDAGEVSAKTGNDGSYTLNGYTATDVGQIVVLAGGVDVLTGQTVGMMVTPHGYTNVNPLTTLLAASPGVSEAELKAKLGIDPSIDLNTYDPLADMQDPLKAAAAQKAFTVAQQVYAVLQTAATLQAQTSDGTVDPADITSIAQKLMDGIMSGSGDSTAILQQATQSTVAFAANGDTALQDSVTAALTTVTSAIETAYQNLATNLQSGDSSAIANSVSVAAVSQSALLDAVSSGDTNTLGVLSNSTSLQNLADSYSSSIANNISNGGTGTVTITAPTVYTVAEAGAAGGSLPAKYTIVDQVSNIANYLSVPGSHALVTGAIGVIAQSSSPINVQDVLDIVGNVPGASFEQKNLALASGNSLSLSVEAANLLADRYMKFASGDDITVQFTPSSELASIVSHAQKLGNLGVDTLAPTTDFVISVSDATEIVTVGHMKFESAATVTMSLTQAEVATALVSSSAAAALAAAGIDQLGGSSAFTLTKAQADNLVSAGLTLDPAHPATVTIDGTSTLLSMSASTMIDYADAGIAHFGVTGNAVTIGQAGVDAMVNAGLDFAPGTAVTLLTGVLTAQDLADGVADLDAVGVTALLGNLNFTPSQFTTLFVDHGLTLASGSTSSLLLQQSDLASSLTSSALAQYKAAGISGLLTDTGLTLTVAQGQAVTSAGLTFASAGDYSLSFTTPSDLDSILASASTWKAAGIDAVQPTGASFSLSYAAAQLLKSAGLTIDPAGTSTISLVLDGSGGNTDQDKMTDVATNASVYAGLGVDLIKAADGDISISANGLNSLNDVGIGFTHGDTVTYIARGATELHTAAAAVGGDVNFATANELDRFALVPQDNLTSGVTAQQALNGILNSSTLHQDLADVRVAFGSADIPVNVGGSAVVASAGITDHQAHVMIDEGLTFATQDILTVSADHAGATHLTTSLKELQHLNIDAVTATGDITVDLGLGTLGTGALPLFGDTDHNGSLSSTELLTQVTLNIDAGQESEVATNAALLHAAGVDTITSLDDLHLTEIEAGDLVDNGLSINYAADVTVDVSEQTMAVLASSHHDAQSLHIDHLNVAGGSVTVIDEQAHGLVVQGLDFVDGNDVSLFAMAGAQGTHLSTSLKDMQALHVDTVLGFTGEHVEVDLGSGPIDTVGLPHFSSTLDVTLSVNASPEPDRLLSRLEGLADAHDALQAAGIDHVELTGSKASLEALNGQADIDDLLAAAGVDHISMSLSKSEFSGPTGLLTGGIQVNELAHVGATPGTQIQATEIDILNGSGHTGMVHFDEVAAAAMISAGLHFDAGDNIMMHVTGTHLANSTSELHNLGVDHVTLHYQGAAFDINKIGTYDNSLDVTLDLSGITSGLDVSDTSKFETMKDHGIDKLAFSEFLPDAASLEEAITDFKTVHDGTGLGFELHLHGVGTGSQDLGSALTAAGLLPASGDDPTDGLLHNLYTAGVNDLYLDAGNITVNDELLNALADSGMLHGLSSSANTNTFLTMTTATTGDFLDTSLKELSDLGVDKVDTGAAHEHLYIDLGLANDHVALGEVRALLGSLVNSQTANVNAGKLTGTMFQSDANATVVVDHSLAELLFSGNGDLDTTVADRMAALGIKQLDVLVAHDQTTTVAPQTFHGVEVKIIGQDADPHLYDDLHQMHK